MRQFFCNWKNYAGNDLSLAYISKVETYDETYIRGIHKHDRITEISLVMDGHGRYFIKDNYFNVTKNDVVVINAGRLHSEGAILPSLCIGIKTPMIIDPIASPVSHFSDEDFSVITQIGALAFNLLKKEDLAAHQLANNLIIESFLPYFNRKITINEHLKKTTSFIVQRAKSYIDNNFHDSINIANVCDNLSISHTYLDRQFQENMEITPIKYLMSRRVGEAQRLLINEPQLSLTQVSMKVGINNVNYFQRIFKNFAGVSPQKFRTLLITA
ncbi:AraC family transcriptional regulator [Paucilactobacillus suebicus]|nr:AraC family transcriptional regulator [Paucilactobacillus suebicus]